MIPPSNRIARTNGRVGLVSLLIGIAAALSACAGAPPTEAERAAAAQAKIQAQARAGVVDPYRQILVLGPSPRFDPANLPGNWYVASRGNNAPRFQATEKDGVVALRLDAGADGSILGRKFRVPLLDMPYLRWGWYLDNAPAARPTKAEAGVEPSVLIRVVVGFRDPSKDETAEAEAEETGDSHAAPKIDRALSLEWRAAEGAPPATASDGSVVLRAGARDAGKWIIEAVDLSRLYAWAWPQETSGKAEIVFVAVGMGPTSVPVTGYVAEVVLSP